MSFRIETREASCPWNSACATEGEREAGAGERADKGPEDCYPPGFQIKVGKLLFILVELYWWQRLRQHVADTQISSAGITVFYHSWFVLKQCACKYF